LVILSSETSNGPLILLPPLGLLIGRKEKHYIAFVNFSYRIKSERFNVCTLCIPNLLFNYLLLLILISICVLEQLFCLTVRQSISWSRFRPQPLCKFRFACFRSQDESTTWETNSRLCCI